MWTRVVVAALGLHLALAGPTDAQTVTERSDYRGTGVALAILPPPSHLHATRPVIVIHHDPIGGLMQESMSMPFIAASTDLFRGLNPGDRVSFGLKDTRDALLVIEVTRLSPANR